MNQNYIKSLFFFLVLLISSSVEAQEKIFKLPSHLADSDYLSKTIIFKVKSDYRNSCNETGVEIPKLINAFNTIGVSDVLKKFPDKTPPLTQYNRFGEKMEDLSLIYELNYTKEKSIVEAINIMLSTHILEYAEPHYLPYSLYVPNDIYADTLNASFNQWHLKNIRAFQAWDSIKGDTNVVVGITDSGTETFHPDLVSSVKYNYADPVNGLDDDADGFTDNFYGWDIGENDSSVQWNVFGHGIHVSGLSSSTADNGIGCAGSGFNCKYLPVKVTNVNGYYTMAYEGIVYAADHGCDIINCSWGGYGGAGEFGQSIINYATNNRNSLVVAACGNSNNTYLIYPASYDNVLSVSSVDIYDKKWDNSSYGINVDIAAPGKSVTSTWTGTAYTSSSGTSMAAPVVSGAAAIVKSKFPNFSAIQIGEQLKVTTDNIDTIFDNIPYAGLLGTGRLNMYKALTESPPSIVMISNSITDNNDLSFISGDTLRISGLFKNYLAQSSNNLKVILSSTSQYINIIDSVSILAVINTLATKDNSLDPFEVKILSSVPYSTQIDFKLMFEDQSMDYRSFQYFSIVINVDYMNIDTNKIGTTATSKGRIGYNIPYSFSQGLGFTYNGSVPYLQCGGFMVGNSTANVSDNVYGSNVYIYDNDFFPIIPIHKVVPNLVSDFEAETIFNDSLAGSNKLGLIIKNKVYAWKSYPKDKFVIFEYNIKNTSQNTLSSIYAGIFMDFDISSDAMKDRINFDAVNKMGYTYSSEGGAYLAIKLLSSGNVHHYAFDMDGAFNGTNNSLNIINGFTSYEKYSALKTAANRNIAGLMDAGNDVADMISTGPFILASGDSVTVSFALIAGDHIADIQASAIAADQIYNHADINEITINDDFYLSDVYPNPAENYTSVSVYLPESTSIDLSIFDIIGKKIKTVVNSKLSKGEHKFVINTEKFAAGIYKLRLSSENAVLYKDITIIR